MDKTILHLLFNYKGTVTNREFRMGTTILFMLLGTYLGMQMLSTISTVITAKMGLTWIAQSNIYNYITSSFTPNLVPFWCIISYSSFMLAAKRIRMLNNNRALAIISGIINYLFFASFIALMTLGMYMVENKELIQFVTPAFIYTIRTLFVIGLVNLIYLCVAKKTEQICLPHSQKRLDVSGYAKKLGNLMLIAVCVSIVTGIILKSLNLLNVSSLYTLHLSSSKIQVIFILYSLIILFFYIKYSIYRLKDAKISILWLVSIMTIYCIMVGLKIWINLNFQSNLTLYYNSVFAIATSFFIAAQYILFLLPSKKEENLE
ncbi:MAG: hypothetical protein FWC39_01125 [Bacteroidetes bacterium]|nr:hypothetical protein [Bacteroidota bacterium]